MKIVTEIVKVGSEQQRKIVAVISVVGAVAAFSLVRAWYRAWKRRQLREKIASFQRQENERRDKIRQRASKNGAASNKWMTTLPFSELVSKLNKGEIKATDVLQAFQYAALTATNENNAVAQFIEAAEQVANQLDQLPPSERRPLHGVPFSVKECYFLKGTETTEGFSQFLGVYNERETAPIVQFMQWLGAVPFVKTNNPQALLTYDCRNPVYGVTSHPLDKTRGPGGSSSGEGALIASRASPIGIGTECGGSIRIPASMCGVYSLKPTWSRVLRGGDFMNAVQFRLIWHDFYGLGFITPDIDTLITVHRLLYSQATFDRFPLNPMAPIPFREELFSSDRKLTIGYFDFNGVIEPVPAVKRAVDEAKQRLEKRGHRLVPWKDVALLKKGYLLYVNSGAIDGQVDAVKAMEEDVEISYQNTVNYKLWRMSNKMKAIRAFYSNKGKLASEVLANVWVGERPQDVNLLARRIVQFREEFADAFAAAKLDALLCPVMPFPALPLPAVRDLGPCLCYTAFFNVLNWPAGVCPVSHVNKEDEAKLMSGYPSLENENDVYHRTIKKFSTIGTITSSVGLPLAVQLAAPQYREEMVLRLMKELSTQQ